MATGDQELAIRREHKEMCGDGEIWGEGTGYKLPLGPEERTASNAYIIHVHTYVYNNYTYL